MTHGPTFGRSFGLECLAGSVLESRYATSDVALEDSYSCGTLIPAIMLLAVGHMSHMITVITYHCPRASNMHL